jgi:hypothetical protein
MGRAAFGYRSFPMPADDPVQSSFTAESVVPHAAPHLPPTCTLFSLVDDALPDTTPPFAAPPPFTAPTPVPQPAIVPAPVARNISLAAMFRVLTGSPDPAASHGDFASREPAFPFRRG